MLSIENVTCTDAYPAAGVRGTAQLGPLLTARLLVVKVFNSAAVVQVYRRAAENQVREPQPLDEVVLGPGSYPFPDCIQMRARNANTRQDAVIYAYLYDQLDPIVGDQSTTGLIAGKDPQTGLPVLVNQPETVFGPPLSQQTGQVLASGFSQVLGPFDMSGYRSTYFQLNVTTTPVQVDLVFEMARNPGVARTTTSFTAPVGRTFKLIRNQGDRLVSVTFSAPTAPPSATLDSEFGGSNLDPLVKGGGDCPIRYNVLNGTQTAFEDNPAADQCHGWVYIGTDTINPATGNDFDIVVKSFLNIQGIPGSGAGMDIGMEGLVDIEAGGTILVGSTGGDAQFFGHVSATLGAQGDTNIGGVGHAVLISDATGQISFFGVAAVGRQTVTGSRGGNAALASLLTGLATLGLIVDSTTP